MSPYFGTHFCWHVTADRCAIAKRRNITGQATYWKLWSISTREKRKSQLHCHHQQKRNSSWQIGEQTSTLRSRASPSSVDELHGFDCEHGGDDVVSVVPPPADLHHSLSTPTHEDQTALCQRDTRMHDAWLGKSPPSSLPYSATMKRTGPRNPMSPVLTNWCSPCG